MTPDAVLKLIHDTRFLVLDFDGTLVDSNPIKLKAFEKCFGGYPQFEAIMAYCQNNHHTPRKTKFRHVFENILKKPYLSETEKKLLEQYAAHTTEQVICAPEIPGATLFLEKFARARETALLSSTPHEILLHILEERKMRHYFKTIQGAPVHKASWLKQFKAEKNCKPAEVLFIGDSEEDAKSAEEAGISFIQIGPAFADFNALFIP